MTRVLRILGIPVISYEVTTTEVQFVSNSSGSFELAPEEYDTEDDYYSPDDPEGFGFRRP